LVKDIELLEKLLKRAMRMIEECAGKTYKERLEIIGLTTSECRRLIADLIEVLNILKGFEGDDEELFF